MALDIDDATRAFIGDHDVAHLATADSSGRPAVVPVCYVFDGQSIYTPVDEKPKGVPARGLKRVRNIDVNPNVSLVIDDYSNDWSKLRYVIAAGTAKVIEPAEAPDEHRRAVDLLREKYPQYRAMSLEERPIIKISPARIKRWAARDG